MSAFAGNMAKSAAAIAFRLNHLMAISGQMTDFVASLFLLGKIQIEILKSVHFFFFKIVENSSLVTRVSFPVQFSRSVIIALFGNMA